MKILQPTFGIMRRVLFRAGLYLPFLVAASYAVAALFGWAGDMFSVTSTAFAVLIALSGAFFALARGLGEDERRSRIIFSGERALHAALQMLAAAVVEFGFRRGEKLLIWWSAPEAILQAERLLGSLLAVALFASALFENRRAIATVSGVLEQRRIPEVKRGS